jgi:hypothetical protein
MNTQRLNQEGVRKADLILNGTSFWLVKNRFTGGRVYSDYSRELYLRFGQEEEIKKEVENTRKMLEMGFPVPEILSSGRLSTGEYFFIEKAVGRYPFSVSFVEEYKRGGTVSDNSFNLFVDTMVKFCQAQFKQRNLLEKKNETIEAVISLQTLLQFNPSTPENIVSLQEAYRKALSRLENSGLPFVHTLPDLNPFNVLPGAIIDFERYGVCYAGYDVLTALYFGDMMSVPRIKYKFTDEQRKRYLDRVDATAEQFGLPKPSKYLGEFLLLKLIWFASKSFVSAQNQRFKYENWIRASNMLEWAVKEYLETGKINPSRFEEWKKELHPSNTIPSLEDAYSKYYHN